MSHIVGIPAHLNPYGASNALPSSKSMSCIPKDKLVQCIYQTQAMRDWQPMKKTAVVDELFRNCKGENFDDVHSIGKKDTRYLKCQINTAPLTNRQACKYTQDFIPLPLGDKQINTELANNWKNMRAAGPRTADAPMAGHKTTSEEAWDAKKSPQQMWEEGQKYGGIRPTNKLTKTIPGSGYLMELKSHEQTHFKVPDLRLAKSERALPPRPGLDIGGAVGAVRCPTAYVREFGKAPKINREKPYVSKRMNGGPPPDLPPGTDGLQYLSLDKKMYTMKRTPFVAPGE